MLMKNKLEELLTKYEDRMLDCQEQFDEDILNLKTCSDAKKRAWIDTDIHYINAQIGAYECIIKDIKELMKNM